MEIFKTIDEVRKYVKTAKEDGKKIGLVPTMGYLHEGHLSLVKQSKGNNDVTIISIFVNPTQFGPNEDYDSYPRDLSMDIESCKAAGVDVIFAPEVEEMYPNGYNTYVDVFGVSEVLCGAQRPGHFRGVATVVTKLFNITLADNAYFGQKDFQQTVVIKRFVEDLNIPINIVVCPIIREQDGLAKSSRNVYLSEQERRDAVLLSQALKLAKEVFEAGERNSSILKNKICEKINESELAKIDYVEIRDVLNLEELDLISDKALVALAVKFGATRLIDNMVLEG